jgi:hypothetical protein
MKHVFRISTFLILALFYAGCRRNSKVLDIDAKTQVLQELGQQSTAADLEAALRLYWKNELRRSVFFACLRIF